MQPYWKLWRYVRYQGVPHKVSGGPLTRQSPVRAKMIRRRVHARADLGSTAAKVALQILDRCGDQLQPAWETQETIAQKCALKVDTVQRAVRTLHDGAAFGPDGTTALPPGPRALFVVDVCPKVGPVKPGRDLPVSTRRERSAGKYLHPMPRERANRNYPIIEFSELTGPEKKWFLAEIGVGRSAPRPVPPVSMAPDDDSLPSPADGTVTERDTGPPAAPGPQSREESVAFAREALRIARHKSRP